jgi:hypothetical protein
MTIKHRGAGTPIYEIWNAMRNRCNNPHIYRVRNRKSWANV